MGSFALSIEVCSIADDVHLRERTRLFMCTHGEQHPGDTLDLTSETAWIDLIPSLVSTARSLAYAYSSQVSSWQGQEEELAQDIVQETARRMIERARKAERGEAEPVHSRKMITITAQNYCKDLRRHDQRLLRPQAYGYEMPGQSANDAGPALFDEICEHIDHRHLLEQVARDIACFPEKQRTALLIDLANRMSFCGQPTMLQQAFLAAGIELADYLRPLPDDRRERNQHMSLLNYALRRVALLPCVQEYLTGVPQPIPVRRARRVA
jgi:DNA-directed RNA polymerase specialized sigma24 family protein